MSKRILIVGCGQLGRRHLEAVSDLKEVSHITVVDAHLAALGQAREFLTQLNQMRPGITFDLSLPIGENFDVCIVATQAAGRCALIQDIVRQTKCRKFLIEKIVAQSVQEYKALMDFAQAQNCLIWVNCKTRAYKIHRYIKEKIGQSIPMVMHMVAGNQGLANNGVHAADLFAFYDGDHRIEPIACRVDEKLHPSKRGASVFDLSGTLIGQTSRGSEMVLSYVQDHAAPETISINTPVCRFWVDHSQQNYFESYADEQWVWRKIEIVEDYRVSFMTKAFVSDILSRGQCHLPTLQQCFVGHEFILNILKDPFCRLLGRPVSLCPVT